MNPPVDVRNISNTVRHYGATHREGDGLEGVGCLGSGFEGLGVLVPGLKIIALRLPPYWTKNDRLDRLCIVLHIVLERRCLGDEKDGFTPISGRRLAEVVGRDFAGRALHLLSAPNVRVLECDGRYTPSRKCRGFRIRDEILALENSVRWIPPKLASKLSDSERRHSQVEVGDDPSHQVLWQNLRLLTLSSFPTDFLPPQSSDPSIQLKRHARQLAVARITGQRWHFATDRRTGRVFNNFTSLSKLLRPYALLDGKPCAEIDIRNSQPFFLAELYPNQSAEARRFIETVCDGQFYETVNEASGSPFPSNAREKLKKAVYSGILFGKRYTESILWSGFESRFPELSRIITDSKSKGHNLLAIDLQRREARLMIKTVVPRLSSCLPGIPFLTVHDSLAIDVRYADQAAAIITECAAELSGNVPTLRMTPPAPGIALPPRSSETRAEPSLSIPCS